MNNKNLHRGGGGRTSSPGPTLPDNEEEFPNDKDGDGVVALLGGTCTNKLSEPCLESSETPGCPSFSCARVLLSGGALCDLVGLCLVVLDCLVALNVFTGGDSKSGSTMVCLWLKRRLLCDSPVSPGLEPSATSASRLCDCVSISFSRVTMIGRSTGFLRIPNVKSLVPGYRGVGDTRTVRSVITLNKRRTELMAVVVDGKGGTVL